MIKWLNYHHLLYFRVIANEGSIAKASKVLSLGQPALSAQLKQLEENLGQKLFERKNRSLVLTDAGKVALQYAEEIFKKGEEFVQVFNDQSLSSKSHYKIGVVDSAPKSLACRLVESAQKYGNNCFISLSEGNPEDLLYQLSKHEIDVVLSNAPSAPGKLGFFSKSIGKSNVGVYGAEKFLELKEDFPASLTGKPFILPTKHSKLRYDIEQAFHSMKIQYELIAEVQDSSVKKLMAEHGKALIFLPELIAKPLEDAKKVYKLGRVEGLEEEFWLLSQQRTISSPITESLIHNFKV